MLFKKKGLEYKKLLRVRDKEKLNMIYVRIKYANEGEDAINL
jgi:hypothetical protein